VRTPGIDFVEFQVANDAPHRRHEQGQRLGGRA
jgi:hypothetical protein